MLFVDTRRPLVRASCIGLTVLLIFFDTHSDAAGPDEDLRGALLSERRRVDVLTLELEKVRIESEVARREVSDIRRSFLRLLGQLELSRQEVSNLRGQIEESQAQSGRQNSQIDELRALKGRQDDQQQALLGEQRKSKELQRALDELRNGLPILVNEDGSNFFAQSSEKAEFDNAKAVFKRANFAAARKQFAEFLLRYPHGGYASAARFWKGNAEFLQGDYKAALITLRPLQMAEPNYQKTPEAMLAIANCYSELKDPQAARKTLEDLVEQYERTEAASVARDRLSKLQ